MARKSGPFFDALRSGLAASLPEGTRVRAYALLRGRRPPRVRSPRTFNDLVNRIKFTERFFDVGFLQDKLLAKEWVAGRSPQVRVPRTLGVFSDARELKASSVPNPSVVKTNHGSGYVFRYLGQAADWQELQRRFSRDLQRTYGQAAVEWSYRYIRPRLFAEEFIGSAWDDLWDYKLFVFRGRVRLIEVDSERFVSHKRALLDEHWRPLAVTFEYPAPSAVPDRPKCFVDLKTAAEQIAAPFEFCRVDFFVVDDQPVFGEVAFYPESGYGRFDPPAFNRELLTAVLEGREFASRYYL